MELIEVSKLKPFPKNDYFFDDLTGPQWEEFKKSIKSSGVIEPVIVTTDLVIISGHQRVRACKELGIEKVLCDIRRFDSEDEQLKQLIETNIKQRGIGNPNSVKLGRCIRELERIEGITHGGSRVQNAPLKNQEEIAQEIGISVDQLKRYKSLTNLIPELSDLVETGEVNVTTAAAIARKLTKEQQQELAEKLEKMNGEIPTNEMLKMQLESASKRNAEYIHKIKDLLDKVDESKARASQMEQAYQVAMDKYDAEKSKPPVVQTVEKLVTPDDYEFLKKDNVRLYNENKKHIEEAQEWERKYKESGRITPTLDEKAKKDMDWLTIGIQEFLRTYGGKAWGLDRRESIDQYHTEDLAAQAKNLLAFAQNLYSIVTDAGEKS